MKLHHFLTTTHKNNFKWIKDLTFSPETIKILEENIGSKISDIAGRNFLSGVSPQARETKEKINKWDSIKLKDFAQQRRSSTK